MKNFLTLLFIAAYFQSQGQTTFQKIYQKANGGVWANAYCVSNDGNYFFAGGETDGVNSFAYLTKINPIGNVIWKKFYSGLDGFESMVKTTDGGFALVGSSDSLMHGYQDLILLRIDSTGNVLWCRQYDYNNRYGYTTAVVQDQDSGFTISGWTIASTILAYAIKTDANGILLWDKIITSGTQTYSIANNVSSTNDGGVIVTGTDVINGEYRLMLVKIDSLGQYIWARSFGNNLRGKISCQTNDGGYISSGFGASTNIQYGLVLLKSDNLGNLQWSKIYSNANEAADLIVNSDGDYVLAGTYTSNDDSASIYLMKTNSQGDTIWTRFYEIDLQLGYNGEAAVKILQTADGGYIIGAKADESNNGIRDTYLLKTDPEGIAICNLVQRSITLESINPPVDTNLTFTNGFTSISMIPPVVSSQLTDTTLCLHDLVSEYEHKVDIDIYPNPSDGFLNVLIPSSSSNELTLEIHDLIGRKILQEKITSGVNNTIDVSGLSKDVYIIRISGKNESGVRYFCKQ